MDPHGARPRGAVDRRRRRRRQVFGDGGVGRPGRRPAGARHAGRRTARRRAHARDRRARRADTLDRHRRGTPRTGGAPRWRVRRFAGAAVAPRAERPSGESYGRSVRVKVNVAEVLRRELARRSWQREVVAIGAATDPYQPAEGRYRLTRACLEAFADARSPFSLITRGPMVVRDIDVLQRAAPLAAVDVTFSIPTLDLDIWRRTEPGTAPPRQRLRALRMLVDAGIDTGVGIAPILPGISDRPELIADVVKAARDAGATNVW